jgi:hypothetical protein
MPRLARPVVPLKEAEDFACSNPKEALVDPCGGFAPLLHTDPRLLALSFASALALLAFMAGSFSSHPEDLKT